jgi:hypothetical protein
MFAASLFADRSGERLKLARVQKVPVNAVQSADAIDASTCAPNKAYEVIECSRFTASSRLRRRIE